MQSTLWQKLRSPFYLFRSGPWVAVAAQLYDLFWFLLAATLLVAVLGMLSTIPFLGFLILMLPILLVLGIPVYGVWFGMTERVRLRLLGHRDVVTAHLPARKKPLHRWYARRCTEPATWREVLALVIASLFLLANSILLAMEAFTLWVTSAVGIALLRQGRDVDLTTQIPGMHVLDPEAGPEMVSYADLWQFPVGLLVTVILFAYLNGLVAATSGTVSRILLAPRPEEMQRQVDRLAFSRARIMESFETERRRIERDLHDGVQQELVNLNLRLGMVGLEVTELERKGAEVGQARQEIDRAQAQAQHALQTLRNTVRGIYPTVLQDHGLRAALEELANNCLLPVDLVWAACSVMPQEVERTAYYAASEAVTNALKHSAADRLRITAHTTEGVLRLEVEDNGQGGAVVRDEQGGVAGLQERARALGGEVWLDSPPGGPTVLRLELPLEGPQGTTEK